MRTRRTALVGLAVLAAAFGNGLVACVGAPDVPAGAFSTLHFYVTDNRVSDVDLLLMIDNSGSMRDNQSHLLSQLGPMIHALIDPPCESPSDPTPHTCDPSNASDVPIAAPVPNIHVGIVDSDLGTPGSPVPGCLNGDVGDDGLLNPIRDGLAMAHHEPWAEVPPTFGRPADCNSPDEFPSFITFTSGTTDPMTFTHDFQCNAGVFVEGCALESQLDAVYRGLIIHDASDSPSNTSPNAGFLRENAVLAIVMLTDEDDGSVRDCRFANGGPCDGPGAIDVYNPASTAWAAMELNLRFYMGQSCGPQDPTWALERYFDPRNPSAGWPGLKPGHPERVVFGAITGLPIDIPMTGTGNRAGVDWDRLLGAPGPNGPDDFCGRDSTGLAALTSAEGPISMQQANADPSCPQRVVPSCRREGTVYSPTSCDVATQYYAWPARRIIEVARRFDQTPLCNGSPCHNGMVSSICRNDYAAAVNQIVAMIQSRLVGPCVVARALDRAAVVDPTGANRSLVEVDCVMYC